MTDNILGAVVDGTSHVTSRPGPLVLVPNPQRGELEMQLMGTVDSQTTSYYGAFQIFSHGVTQFRSAKRMGFDGQTVRLQPARTTAETHLTMTGMDTSLRLAAAWL